MNNVISVGVVHPYLSLDELNLFVDSYNKQTLEGVKFYFL